MQPKITIITASYNSETTIADTLKSVLNQTYENIEYVIIDGDSTDSTIKIVKDYEPLFCGRLKWISEKDNGIYDAWNKGIKLATGEWITFVGSDDILLCDAMKEYMCVVEKENKVNFISSRICHVKENLDPIRVVGQPWSEKMYTYCCIAHVGSLHRKCLFDQNGGFNTTFKIAGDYDFLLRCSKIIVPTFIPVITASVREGGISNRNIFLVAKEVLRTKTSNNYRPVFKCYFDFIMMILKYYGRSFLNIFS